MKRSLWFLAAIWSLALPGRAASNPPAPAPVTFNKEIAPIIYNRCAPCHHRGESTPFDLITYAQVAKRARQIVDVTALGYMPPWPPQSGGGYPALAGDRRLSDAELSLIRRWVSDGAIEGAPADLPPAPQWSGEWQLGPPDLIVEMQRTYNLPAEGKDVYRCFVIPSPVTERRYVRAIEFRPETRAAHHVFIKTDQTRQTRLLDASQPEAGFPGLAAPSAVKPVGQFLTWQPGKRACVSPAEMPWILQPGTDLVLEAHLRPTGKMEPIRFKVGLYFTNRPPERTAFTVLLASLGIDIPAGASHFAVDSSFQLPVGCEVLGVLPHCHFLGREVEGHAELPDGARIPLLSITNWDFNWQGDYRFQTPVPLPPGAVLHMQITYDNSTNNPRNPNSPPRRVRYGLQSTDEMAELSFLVLPERAEDEKILETAYVRHVAQTVALHDEQEVREHPNDAALRLNLGNIRLAQGRIAEAQQEIERAIELDPNLALAHYYAGVIARLQNRLPDAERELQISVRLNPADGKAWGNLGLVQIGLQNFSAARQSLQRALDINPSDTIARRMLDQLPK
jgi:hypothetical protein